MSHPLGTVDPQGAEQLRNTILSARTRQTQATYRCASRDYEEYCHLRGLHAWPADELTFCAWMVHTATRVRISSLKKYMSGVQAAQIMKGLKWPLRGSSLVGLTLRGLTKRWGTPDRALKTPVTMGIVLRMFRQLPGWPCLSRMSHNDRCFVAATLIARLALLRGGEFLASTSDRPVLRSADVRCAAGDCKVTVMVTHPKAKWWLPSDAAVAYAPYGMPEFDPVHAMLEYRRLSVVPLPLEGPAFRLSCGSTLTRKWMVTRTSELCFTGGVVLTDSRGQPVPLGASSWRAGGVLDAMAAGLGDATIKALGRWASAAHLSYSFISHRNLQAATTASVRTAVAAGDERASFVVGSFNPSSIFEDLQSAASGAELGVE